MKYKITKLSATIELLDGTIVGTKEMKTTKLGTAWFHENGKMYNIELDITGSGRYIIIDEKQLPGYDLIKTPTP